MGDSSMSHVPTIFQSGSIVLIGPTENAILFVNLRPVIPPACSPTSPPCLQEGRGQPWCTLISVCNPISTVPRESNRCRREADTYSAQIHRFPPNPTISNHKSTVRSRVDQVSVTAPCRLRTVSSTWHPRYFFAAQLMRLLG